MDILVIYSVFIYSFIGLLVWRQWSSVTGTLANVFYWLIDWLIDWLCMNYTLSILHCVCITLCVYYIVCLLHCAAAACLVSGTRRYDHTTLVLHQLHWLPVRKRMDLKIATLVYHLLSVMAPAYLATDCQLSSEEGRHQLFLSTRGLVSSGGPTATLGPMFRGCWSKAVPQPPSWSWENGHRLWTV